MSESEPMFRERSKGIKVTSLHSREIRYSKWDDVTLEMRKMLLPKEGEEKEMEDSIDENKEDEETL